MRSEFHSQNKSRSVHLNARAPSKPAITSQLQTPVFTMQGGDGDDDDFQTPLTLPLSTQKSTTRSRKPLKSSNSAHRHSKKLKLSDNVAVVGKENMSFQQLGSGQTSTFFEVKTSATHDSVQVQRSNHRYALDDCRDFKFDEKISLDRIQSSIDCTPCEVSCSDSVEDTIFRDKICSLAFDEKKGMKKNGGYLLNSIESKLIVTRKDCDVDEAHGSDSNGKQIQQFDELEVLLNLCSQTEEEDGKRNMALHHLQRETCGIDSSGCLVQCPLCGIDITDLTEEKRQVHTNDCLDNKASSAEEVIPPIVEIGLQASVKVLDVSPVAVVEWLRNLGLGRYEEIFVKEEIDWDTLQWLKEEDLINIGISALGPRKKIVRALEDLRQGNVSYTRATTEHEKRRIHIVELQSDLAEGKVETNKHSGNKLITDYFPLPTGERKKATGTTGMQHTARKSSSRRMNLVQNQVRNRQFKDIPPWCCIPGTPFRVDAFRFLRGDCSYWFLTHFHLDHYQGLTRNFSHGKIYCSLITAKLVNLKIGIPWDKLQVLPVNQKINIVGVDVTCLEANHCAGSLIILFEPPNGKAVLHTGDFRYSDGMANHPVLQACSCIHTLILDTTYCNPQFDFPKQEAVIQFVIDAIQAEAFNPKTLFLIGSYTIGKERLFLEVARVLRKKVYVTAAKLNLLKCLGFVEEDMKWFTLNERETNIHVVPMWTLASFKRLKHISNQYADRFSLIVAFSPTGWTFGKCKKKSPGRRWQQGTIIRYEVPYSEHCSFSELKEFVKLLSPVDIIPSVNNKGPESAEAMISLMLS